MVVDENNASQGARKGRRAVDAGCGDRRPAITGGALLMMNRIAIALFVAFGPLFVLCLLFDFTKQLFSKWLYYGICTMFSMAVLSAMVSISMKVILCVWVRCGCGKTFPFWEGHRLDAGTSLALQQGGLGLILTILIVSAPPMAASFFQGVLGSSVRITRWLAVVGLPILVEGRWVELRRLQIRREIQQPMVLMELEMKSYLDCRHNIWPVRGRDSRK